MSFIEQCREPGRTLYAFDINRDLLNQFIEKVNKKGLSESQVMEEAIKGWLSEARKRTPR